MCASKAPTATTTSVESPSFLAHSSLSVPAGLSDVHILLYSLSVNPSNKGSSDLKKSLGGKPLNASDHNPLCPAGQTPRLSSEIFFPPVNTKGIQSQCSTHE